MKHRMYFVAAAVFLFAAEVFAQQANHVVISEIYGGGGNNGGVYNSDFIELHNPTNSAISLDGWSVQYLSSSAASFPMGSVHPISGTIAPKGYFLCQEAAGTGTSQPALPAPDAVGGLALSGSNGKIALSKGSVAITGYSDPDLVDFAAYGTSALFEGTGPAPAASNSTSVERKASAASTAVTMGIGGTEEFAGNGYDSNNNSADFIVRTPQPQNSASPTEPVSSGGDILPPNILSVKSLSSTQIEIRFNEPVDSLSSSTSSNYTLDQSMTVNQASRDVSNRLRVVLDVTSMPVGIYTLTIKNIKDTSGNALSDPKIFKFCVGVLTMAQARSAGAGVAIRVRGVITVGNDFQAPPAYIQDSTGALAVFNYNLMNSVKRGDIWEIAGTLKDFNGLMEIDPVSDTVKVSSGNPLPDPKLITSTGLNESLESQLVRINRVQIEALGSFSTLVDSVYIAGDPFGSLSVFVSKGSNIAGSPIPGDSVNLIGVVNERNGVYRLLPRMLADMNVIDPPPSQTWMDINIARSQGVSAVVTVRGVVTYAQPSKTAGRMTIFIQDFSGGISLYDSKTDALVIGDSVEVNGVLMEFSGLMELSPVNSVTLLGTRLPLPAPKVITMAQASEAYESQLVKIFGVRFNQTGTFSGGTSGTTYSMTDGTMQLDVRIPFGSALVDRIIPGGLLDIVGVLGQFTPVYQLIPRDAADLIVYPGPQISSVPSVSAVTDASFTVDWKTFFPGTSVVYFGSTKNLGDSVFVSAPTTNHSLTVSGLKSGRIYYYQVFSADDNGAAASFVAAQVTTSSASSGVMNAYFN
ncbi:MAG: hypothetical protein EHM64_14655, partial [Ignavibacteriae bacterium]